MTKNRKSNPALFPVKPWSQNDHPIWLASTVRLQRNLEKFKFPTKLAADRKPQIVTLLKKALLSKDVYTSAGLVDPFCINGEAVDTLEKEYLMEHFLSVQSYNLAQEGEGFLLDHTGEFLAAFNMGDHLQLEFIDCKGDLENVWNRLLKLETALEKSVNYAFSPKFGFLTSDPTVCGTALTVTVYVQLTGLIHTGKIDEFLEKHADESFLISGIQGNPNEVIGDILVVQNNYTLGVTEENIVALLRNFTTKVTAEEMAVRNEIKREDKGDFKDKVSRAYGILMHSYQIEAIEALNALSLLKFGVEAGWIAGIDYRSLNELFFNCRRAHLLHLSSEKLSQSEILHKRAETIHAALKEVKLLV